MKKHKKKLSGFSYSKIRAILKDFARSFHQAYALFQESGALSDLRDI